MLELNRVAQRGGLIEYTTYSRVWEYPWLWQHLAPLQGRGLRVLDVGSEKSSFPWFLASHGFRVIVSDMLHEYWDIWKHAARALGEHVDMRLFDATRIDLPTASVDIYLSVSVIEHIADKARALAEAARVLKPGGILMLSFDICEPDQGMTFPDWNGHALTMREFDDFFRTPQWFDPGLAEIAWNINSIPEYWDWNRATASHHNYITGAALIRRNAIEWRESAATRVMRQMSAATNPLRRRALFNLTTLGMRRK
jgi:SAM-dependent methyltransferase